jgi:hypothetical protein
LYQFDGELDRAVQEFAGDMGVDPAATQAPATQPQPHESHPEAAGVPGLDPDLARVIEHPQIRAFLENEAGRYEQAVQEAGQFAAASLVDALPELAQIDRSQWPMAIELLAKTAPERVQRATGVINRAVQIGAEQQRLSAQAQSRQQAQRNAEIEKWSRAEGARWDQWAAKEGIDVASFAPQASRYISEQLGMSRDQFSQALRDTPALRSSAFQQVLSDAVRYRQVVAAKQDIARKPLPPAPLRPGAQAPGMSANSNAGQIARLTQQLNNSSGQKALRAAAALLSAQRNKG